MKHLALFNGIGGFQLAAHWVGWQNVAHVEIDPFCNKVVAKHFPKSKCHTDIRQFNGKEYEGTIDIISGGFPCQPFSVAGKQRGKEDDRNLWTEMFRVIQEVHPAWIVGENVANLTNFMEFENAILDLESEGYEVQPFIIPAVAVGAWHRRDRVWIIAKNSDNIRRNSYFRKEESENGRFGKFGAGNIQRIFTEKNATDTKSKRGKCRKKREQGKYSQLQKRLSRRYYSGNIERQWNAEPGVGRVVNGLPDRVDRLKSLGNAIVPQVAYKIFKVIDEISKTSKND